MLVLYNKTMSKNQLQEVTIYQALHSQELFSFSVIHYFLR